MPFAENYMVQGQFTVPAAVPASYTVNCGFFPSKVELYNESSLLSMAGGPPLVNPGANYLMYRASWNGNFANAATPFTLVEAITASAATSSLFPITSNGISLYDGHAASPGQFLLGPKLAGTNTAKATGRFTISSTASLFPGATVLMTSNSVNKQLGGMFFTVNSIVSSTVFDIANASWLNTANFTNGAETFNVQLVSVPSLYYPQNAQIVNISAAGAAVVTTSTNTNLTVGQQVKILVPSVFGMVQANKASAVISAISGNQVTLGGAAAGSSGGFGVNNGLNSSAFTAFAWPAATSVPFGPALLVPQGSGPYQDSLGYYNADTLQDATLNLGYQGFTVGSGILATPSSTVVGLTAGDIISWTAWRGDV